MPPCALSGPVASPGRARSGRPSTALTGGTISGDDAKKRWSRLGKHSSALTQVSVQAAPAGIQAVGADDGETAATTTPTSDGPCATYDENDEPPPVHTCQLWRWSDDSLRRYLHQASKLFCAKDFEVWLALRKRQWRDRRCVLRLRERSGEKERNESGFKSMHRSGTQRYERCARHGDQAKCFDLKNSRNASIVASAN